MAVILILSNHARWGRFTPVFAGLLIALYITVEAPFSGTSMNPARTFASAWSGDVWRGFWVYMTAPPLAMLAASEIYVRGAGVRRVYCAKLHHFNDKRCIFNCRFHEMVREES